MSGSLEESVAKRLPEEAEAVRTIFARYLGAWLHGRFWRKPKTPASKTPLLAAL